MAVTFQRFIARQVVPDSAATDSLTTEPFLMLRELPETLGSMAMWKRIPGHVLETLLILLAAWIVIKVVDRSMKSWMRRFEDLPNIDPGRQRALTIGKLIASTVRYIVWPLAIITVVSEFGINVGALIATAGIASLAIGFGAQTLVRDVISGVFLLFDETIHVGDFIRFGDDSGVVEEIGIRLIRVRRFDGELLMIPAGELRVFGNRSVDFMRVIVEIDTAYEANIDNVLGNLQAIAEEWADEHREIMLDDAPEVQAVTRFGESSVVLRIIARVQPGEQWEAERNLRLLIKQRFDERGVEIPFPRRTVYVRREDEPDPA